MAGIWTHRSALEVGEPRPHLPQGVLPGQAPVPARLPADKINALAHRKRRGYVGPQLQVQFCLDLAGVPGGFG